MDLERVVSDLVHKMEHRFYGKYRAFVADNADPEKLGRLRLRIPSLLGSDVVTGWALPCLPYGGAAGQGFLFIPERDAGVWVEFEEGDLEFPIWIGAFWSKPGGESELPKPNDADGTEQDSVQGGEDEPPTSKIIKTLKGHTIQFEDADGDERVTIVQMVDEQTKNVINLDADGIVITDANENNVEMTADGITVTDANGNTIEMTSDGITLTDANNNIIDMSASAFTITAAVKFSINASGQAVEITGSTIDFIKG